jgi:hypothetical protein
MNQNQNIEITSDYWLSHEFQNEGWTRLFLLHKRSNADGGSWNTPIVEIDIVKHPSGEYFFKHHEVRFNIRNNVKRRKNEILVDGNEKDLRHTEDIVDAQILSKAVEKMLEKNLITLPFSIYTCMVHVEKFEAIGDFWKKEDLDDEKGYLFEPV